MPGFFPHFEKCTEANWWQALRLRLFGEYLETTDGGVTCCWRLYRGSMYIVGFRYDSAEAWFANQYRKLPTEHPSLFY